MPSKKNATPPTPRKTRSLAEEADAIRGLTGDILRPISEPTPTKNPENPRTLKPPAPQMAARHSKTKIPTLTRRKHRRRTTARQDREIPPESKFDPSNTAIDTGTRHRKSKNSRRRAKNRPQPSPSPPQKRHHSQAQHFLKQQSTNYQRFRKFSAG